MGRAAGTPAQVGIRRHESVPAIILRPVATSLLMAAILLVGIVAYTQLPVSALPEVDYPTIQVITFYPGASPDVTASAVTAPLERQFGEVPGLSQMTSTSSSGSSMIVLQFELIWTLTLPSRKCKRLSTRRKPTYHPIYRRRLYTARRIQLTLPF